VACVGINVNTATSLVHNIIGYCHWHVLNMF
jgi:hypothetical protein